LFFLLTLKADVSENVITNLHQASNHTTFTITVHAACLIYRTVNRLYVAVCLLRVQSLLTSILIKCDDVMAVCVHKRAADCSAQNGE